MSRYLSKRFEGMAAYVPGEQPQGGEIIKLNTNESPFPPSPLVADAISRAEVERLNLYSDPDAREARTVIADSLGVAPENVIIGNGSDELLAFSFQAFCDGTVPAVFADITYGFYKVYARINCVEQHVIPLDGALRIVPSDYYGAGGTVFIANPNAPTGHAVPAAEIEGILRENPGNAVVIDEAYSAFGGESVVPLTSRYGNLIVIRTMSKSMNLAGARLAYAISSPELTADLNLMKFSFNPYNVNRLSLLAATAAFRDPAYYDGCVAKIKQTREFTAAEFSARGFSVLPSAANFLFVKPGFIGGEAYYKALKARGVLVRHFGQARISDYVRITVGTDEQMRRLLQITDELINLR